MASVGNRKYNGPKALSLLPPVFNTRYVTNRISKRNITTTANLQGSVGMEASSRRGRHNFENSSENRRHPIVSKAIASIFHTS